MERRINAQEAAVVRDIYQLQHPIELPGIRIPHQPVPKYIKSATRGGPSTSGNGPRKRAA